MARPIRETPILFGEDAKRFEEKARNAKCTITREEFNEMYQSYLAGKAAMARGEKIMEERRKQRIITVPRRMETALQ